MIIHKYLLQLREIPVVVRGAGWLLAVVVYSGGSRPMISGGNVVKPVRLSHSF